MFFIIEMCIYVFNKSIIYFFDKNTSNNIQLDMILIIKIIFIENLLDVRKDYHDRKDDEWLFSR